MSHNEDTSYSNPNLHLSTASISSNNPAIPFKRPRSNSIPPSSPTGSTSSKRAISEDDFASSTAMQLQSQPQAQAPSTAVSAGDVDMSSQADDSAMTIEHDSGATMRQQPLATAAFTVPEEEGEGEVVRRTESVHIGDSGPNGSGNTEKYAELYNELLSEYCSQHAHRRLVATAYPSFADLQTHHLHLTILTTATPSSHPPFTVSSNQPASSPIRWKPHRASHSTWHP